jgi:hypothetical protein
MVASRPVDHFYVFEYVENSRSGRKPYYYYERTCGTERAAQERVDELNKRGRKAVYLINHLVKGYFY